MISPLPLTRELVLIGGGHTHALVLHKWGMDALPGVRLTLINPEVTAPYTGMLPGYVAGHYEREQLDIDMVKLARYSGARLVLDKAVGIDVERKRVLLKNRPEIAYDTLSINVGITSELSTIRGFDDNAIGAKPLGPFASAWDSFLEHASEKRIAPSIAIIGAGVGGAELALAMAHRLRQGGVVGGEVTLLEATDQPLREIAPGARTAIFGELERYGVKLRLNASIREVKPGQLVLGGEETSLKASLIVSAAGAKPHPWLASSGLPLNDGFIAVDKTLQVVGAPHIFAAGDCAYLSHAPRPKAGVFAVREAPILFDNLRADLSGRRMTSYHPQRDYLKLISTGRKSAIADKFGVTFRGKWLWKIKNSIDLTFMDQFAEIKLMPAPEIPENVALGVKEAVGDGDPLCSGCGSKVARLPLMLGLGESSKPSHFDDAAIIETNGATEVLTTDHLKSFTNDPWVIGRVAAIHAMGDIWAMGGVPKHALSTLILPHMSAGMHTNMVREIMAGARAAFEEAGAAIVGGHTSIGADLTVGFTVRGGVDGKPITLAGATPGDILVLTKPIGTGVILAAEMRRRVDPHAYAATLESMMRSQGKAAAILAKTATAMTDVTGFGLAGHLLTILEASKVGAELDLEALPLLPDALRLSGQGLRSSIWQANSEVAARMTFKQSAKTDLLFDPQTGGGLLACIPEGRLEATLASLRQENEPVWIIGRVVRGSQHIRAI
jgi:selenide,water dikinase